MSRTVGIVTAPVLDANGGAYWGISVERRDELCAWLTRNGLDPLHVTSVELDVVDIPLIRVTWVDDECQIFYDANGLPVEVEFRVIETPMKEPQPTWWQPS